MRPLALAGVSGGFASLALQSLREFLLQQPAAPPIRAELLEPVICPDPVRSFDFLLLGLLEVDSKSLLIGIFIGLILGPLLEVLCLVRQIWILQLRNQLRVPASVYRDQSRDSYRVLG